ncbi:sensor histidine kinase [Desulfobacula phenolica]|uniref:histidine kinase n=1 Tax=Desulfobacula phenolica TaxID=90732 RepID=A0A1H2IQP5_9BACT|nr:HAMP domain-containing sensor histidine kinase [Desulfobacula phenolica]SDU46206.1 two-component system, OmpR family, sensor histidine kinase CpxA [Desulfobacula phenolica]
MIRPVSSLFSKIVGWFFLNIALVATVPVIFIVFQPQVNLHAVFGEQVFNRLRTAGMLMAHDLKQTSRDNWSKVLARHAEIHQVDFTLVLEDASCFSSMETNLPEEVIARAREALDPKPHPGHLTPPDRFGIPQGRPVPPGKRDPRAFLEKEPMGKKSHLIMRTRHPVRYWTGIRILLPPGPSSWPAPALLLAVSDSVTGNGFFIDPLPWMIAALAMMLMSILLWIPMVKSITRPLARITLATEKIARGCFHVSIHEPRSDEIGRLARAVTHMAARLEAFVKGQKRFLGDVAHELGSPIARIQFGLGALKQRIQTENRQRVIEVMEDVDHLSKLIQELLAFSRADMNNKTVRLEAIDLGSVVQTAVKRENTPAAEIITTIDPGIRVVASVELLIRAIANLLRNAVKYAGEAGPIHVYAEKRNHGVAIEVRDLGPGVPEYLLDQLFEPFFRPEPSRDRDSGGVGLGLAIVKTCIETCKGSVSARNLKSGGFAVTIILTAY